MTRSHVQGALAVAALASLAACGKVGGAGGMNPFNFGGKPADPTAALLAGSNPGMVCASPETMAGLKAAIVQNIATGDINPSANPTYKTQLTTGVNVTNSLPRLEEYKADIKRVKCSAKLTLTWPSPLVTRLNTAHADPNWAKTVTDASYSVQPQADGKGYVYLVDPPAIQAASGAIANMVNTLAEADGVPTAPRYNASNDTSGPSSDHGEDERDDGGHGQPDNGGDSGSGNSQSLSGRH